MAIDQQSLEQRLEELLSVESFDPPEAFADEALIKSYEQPDDPVAYWAEQAKALDWFEGWDKVLDDSNPPFYKWFTGGKLNVSHNCLDRHVEAGNGDRVAFHWHASRARPATSAMRICTATSSASPTRSRTRA